MQGLGWVHANDRQMQTLLTRALLHGRSAELIKADKTLIEIDTYMRRMNFMPDPIVQQARLEPETRRILDAYVQGFNHWMNANRPVFEFYLIGYRDPEPYTVVDCFYLSKALGFLGLADIQAQMQKFLVEMIQNDVAEDKIRELFPYLSDPIDSELIKKVALSPPMVPEAIKWLKILPRFCASNSWVVAGRHTHSGFPMLCNDPHLEVNRLPNVCQEVILRLPDTTLIGMTVPGLPAMISGRNTHLAWGLTYSYMDMLDYRIEKCRDGKYFRENGWHPFKLRHETIKVKNRAPVEITVYENEHGQLEGNPHKEGHYLTLGWSAAEDCGAHDFNAIIKVMTARSVETAMVQFKKMEVVSMNWVMADTAGNIGYQMSGRHVKRPETVSGLLPRAGWDPQADPLGFNDPDDLPSQYNPPEGIIVTANDDLNHLGRSKPINLCMAPYRAKRILQLLTTNESLDVAYMKDMQYDLYSLQAERLMKIIRPLLPDTPNGIALKLWDMRYDPDSIGAMLFESVYRALIHTAFGDHGLGRNVVNYVVSHTALFNDYFGNIDRIMDRASSAWFDDHSREALFKEAIKIGLDVQPVAYKRTCSITMTHLLLGGRLPKFVGFDYGPITLPGSRATIVQGQIFNHAGRLTTFSPVYRLITDMATVEAHTNMAGGPSDRPFSKWYLSDFKNWYEGNYKVLK